MKAEWNQSPGSKPISMVGRVSVLPTDPLGNPYGDGEARVFVANVYDPGKYKVFVGISVPYGVTLDDPLDACDGLALTADESIELGKMLLRSGELAGGRADEGKVLCPDCLAHCERNLKEMIDEMREPDSVSDEEA